MDKHQQEIATLKNDEVKEAQTTMEGTAKKPLLMRLFFSGAITNDTKISKKIAYIAILAAFLSVANMFEIKFADVQFSFTIAVSALAGVVLGAVFGFAAAFLGDLVGFLYNSGGFAYMPWVGIALGVTAFLSGIIVGGLNFKFKGALFVKITILALASFFVCTVGINTTAFYLLYAKGVPYLLYAVTRIFVGGQIYNCIVNYALLFVLIPLIAKLKVVSFNY